MQSEIQASAQMFWVDVPGFKIKIPGLRIDVPSFHFYVPSVNMEVPAPKLHTSSMTLCNLGRFQGSKVSTPPKTDSSAHCLIGSVAKAIAGSLEFRVKVQA